SANARRSIWANSTQAALRPSPCGRKSERRSRLGCCITHAMASDNDQISVGARGDATQTVTTSAVAINSSSGIIDAAMHRAFGQGCCAKGNAAGLVAHHALL